MLRPVPRSAKVLTALKKQPEEADGIFGGRGVIEGF
jgi:hypothetical protein